MCRDANLRELFNVLERAGEKLLGYYTVKYLEACKQLYKICVMKTLHPDYKLFLEKFTFFFNILHKAGYVNETTKVDYYQYNSGLDIVGLKTYNVYPRLIS